MADGYPSQEMANRAWAQADAFAQQTRDRAYQQMTATQQTYSGGAHPGVLGYAGQMFASAGNAVGNVAGPIAGTFAATAAFGGGMAQGAWGQFSMASEGARYSQVPHGLTGLLTTAFAPRWLAPHAAMAFGMEASVRRERSREELGRRWDQFGINLQRTALEAGTFGVYGFLERRYGLEAAYMTKIQSEKTLQDALGFMRSGQAGATGTAAGGFGVTRDFLRGANAEMVATAQRMQRDYGLSAAQINRMDVLAAGMAGQELRVAQQRGGSGEVSSQIAGIREQIARSARELQLTEKEVGEYGKRLATVMNVTKESFARVTDENKRLALQGPFSQRAVSEARMQFMQMGNQLRIGGEAFSLDAMRLANEAARQQTTGIIRGETVIREGGGTDANAVLRMMMMRLQQQAAAVQGGNFNQALMMMSQNPQAYQAMMSGGAGFMQTQALAAQTLMRNPFALLQAQMDPAAIRNMTLQAPQAAFAQAQQMGQFYMGSPEARRAQMIQEFGGRMGFNIATPEGLIESRTRYEEFETRRWLIQNQMRRRGLVYSARDTERATSIVMNFADQQNVSIETAIGRLRSVGLRDDATEQVREMQRGIGVERVRGVYREMAAYGEGWEGANFVSRGGAGGASAMVNRLNEFGRRLEEAGYSKSAINQVLFGGTTRTTWSETTGAWIKRRARGGATRAEERMGRRVGLEWGEGGVALRERVSTRARRRGESAADVAFTEGELRDLTTATSAEDIAALAPDLLRRFSRLDPVMASNKKEQERMIREFLGAGGEDMLRMRESYKDAFRLVESFGIDASKGSALELFNRFADADVNPLVRSKLAQDTRMRPLLNWMERKSFTSLNRMTFEDAVQEAGGFEKARVTFEQMTSEHANLKKFRWEDVYQNDKEQQKFMDTMTQEQRAVWGLKSLEQALGQSDQLIKAGPKRGDSAEFAVYSQMVDSKGKVIDGFSLW